MAAHCSCCPSPSAVGVGGADYCDEHWSMRCDHTAEFAALEEYMGPLHGVIEDPSERLAVLNEWLWCHQSSTEIGRDNRRPISQALGALVVLNRADTPTPRDLPCRDEDDRRRAWAELCASVGCACVVRCEDCGGTGGHRTGLDTARECHCSEGWLGTPRDAIRGERRLLGLDPQRKAVRTRRDPEDQPCLDDGEPRNSAKGKVAA